VPAPRAHASRGAGTVWRERRPVGRLAPGPLAVPAPAPRRPRPGPGPRGAPHSPEEFGPEVDRGAAPDALDGLGLLRPCRRKGWRGPLLTGRRAGGRASDPDLGWSRGGQGRGGSRATRLRSRSRSSRRSRAGRDTSDHPHGGGRPPPRASSSAREGPGPFPPRPLPWGPSPSRGGAVAAAAALRAFNARSGRDGVLATAPSRHGGRALAEEGLSLLLLLPRHPRGKTSAD